MAPEPSSEVPEENPDEPDGASDVVLDDVPVLDPANPDEGGV